LITQQKLTIHVLQDLASRRRHLFPSSVLVWQHLAEAIDLHLLVIDVEKIARHQRSWLFPSTLNTRDPEGTFLSLRTE
jgi:hypothetical protein